MDYIDLRNAVDRMGRGARTKLAMLLQLDTSTVSKLLEGKRRIQAHEIPLLEEFVQGQSPGGMTAPAGQVRVFGVVAAAGEMISLAHQDARARYVALHPNQADYRERGAVEVVGESMFPRYKPREIVYFVFGLTPRRGDDAIVELNNGEAMLKEYVMQKQGAVFLKEYFPEERQFHIDASKVKALHAVVGRG